MIVSQKGSAFLSLAQDEQGYPNMEWERFYQQGMSCYMWSLPKPYVRQAFAYLCAKEKAKGRTVAMWQVRAFIYGCSGRDHSGLRARQIDEGKVWPVPADSSWRPVIVAYPSGQCVLDFLNEQNAVFWSDEEPTPAIPSDRLARGGFGWFEQMGFHVLSAA